MTNTEDALRRALATQPPHTTPNQLLDHVERGLARRHRARVTATAAAVAVVIAGAAGGASMWAAHRSAVPTHLETAGQPGGVAWVNTPGKPATAPEPASPPSAQAAYPPCSGDQLTASPGPEGGGAGTVVQYVTLTNRGDAGCSLQGEPSQLTATRPNGAPVTMPPPAHQNAAAAQLRTPANLAPGQNAVFALSSSDQCTNAGDPQSNLFGSFRFGVGHGPNVTVTFPENAPVQLPCGVTVSDFGQQQQPQDPAAANPLHVLTAQADLPATITTGSTVHFQVTLSNPTNYPVTLDPCPTYSEFLASTGTAPSAAAHTYQLNCDGAGGSIPANGHVVFDMQVPAPQFAGEAKLGWFIPGVGVATGQAVTVSGP